MTSAHPSQTWYFGFRSPTNFYGGMIISNCFLIKSCQQWGKSHKIRPFRKNDIFSGIIGISGFSPNMAQKTFSSIYFVFLYFTPIFRFYPPFFNLFKTFVDSWQLMAVNPFFAIFFIFSPKNFPNIFLAKARFDHTESLFTNNWMTWQTHTKNWMCNEVKRYLKKPEKNEAGNHNQNRWELISKKGQNRLLWLIPTKLVLIA